MIVKLYASKFVKFQQNMSIKILRCCINSKQFFIYVIKRQIMYVYN